jgi:hypothetical protein
MLEECGCGVLRRFDQVFETDIRESPLREVIITRSTPRPRRLSRTYGCGPVRARNGEGGTLDVHRSWGSCVDSPAVVPVHALNLSTHPPQHCSVPRAPRSAVRGRASESRPRAQAPLRVEVLALESSFGAGAYMPSRPLPDVSKAALLLGKNSIHIWHDPSADVLRAFCGIRQPHPAISARTVERVADRTTVCRECLKKFRTQRS